MKYSKIKKQDSFQHQLKTFKSMLIGAKMAKASSIILIAFSLGLSYHVRENVTAVVSLFIGILSLVFFIEKFLSLKGIQQKSYTQTSLVSSISKFKAYISNRKKYEMYFMALWGLTIIPYMAINLELKSNLIAIAGILICIAIVGFLGHLAFTKIDREIALLEKSLEKELLAH